MPYTVNKSLITKLRKDLDSVIQHGTSSAKIWHIQQNIENNIEDVEVICMSKLKAEIPVLKNAALSVTCFESDTKLFKNWAKSVVEEEDSKQIYWINKGKLDETEAKPWYCFIQKIYGRLTYKPNMEHAINHLRSINDWRMNHTAERTLAIGRADALRQYNEKYPENKIDLGEEIISEEQKAQVLCHYTQKSNEIDNFRRENNLMQKHSIVSGNIPIFENRVNESIANNEEQMKAVGIVPAEQEETPDLMQPQENISLWLDIIDSEENSSLTPDEDLSFTVEEEEMIKMFADAEEEMIKIEEEEMLRITSAEQEEIPNLLTQTQEQPAFLPVFLFVPTNGQSPSLDSMTTALREQLLPQNEQQWQENRDDFLAQRFDWR